MRLDRQSCGRTRGRIHHGPTGTAARPVRVIRRRSWKKLARPGQLVVLAIAFASLAVLFWVTTDGPVPFEVAPLGARFLAAGLAFFAVLAGWPALRPALSEARVPLLSLVAYGIGGLLAAAVHPGQLEAGPLGYLAALVGVIAIAGLALIRGSRPV